MNRRDLLRLTSAFFVAGVAAMRWPCRPLFLAGRAQVVSTWSRDFFSFVS